MRSGEEDRTQRLLKLFVILDVTEAIAAQAGTYLRTFRRSKGLEIADALIAATAKHQKIELVTRNIRHSVRAREMNHSSNTANACGKFLRPNPSRKWSPP